MNDEHDLFARIGEAASLSAVARDLNVSPAMVSKRLAALEARLGTRLAHRTTRRLSLTEAGARFHRDVLSIRAAVRDAEARVSGDEEPGGTLRISAPTSFGRLHVAPHLGAFVEAYPRLTVQFDLSDDFVDLLAGHMDVAVRIASHIERGLTAHRLGTSERVLCAAPAYLERRGTPRTLGELQQHQLLAASGQMPWRLNGPDGPLGIDGTSRVLSNSSEVVRELTLAGVGIALRSLWDVSANLIDGSLVRILPDLQGSADVAIFVVHARAPKPPRAVTAFVQYMQRLQAVSIVQRDSGRSRAAG